MLEKLFERYPNSFAILQTLIYMEKKESDPEKCKLQIMKAILDFFSNYNGAPPTEFWMFLSKFVDKFYANKSLKQILEEVGEGERAFTIFKKIVFGKNIVDLIKRRRDL